MKSLLIATAVFGMFTWGLASPSAGLAAVNIMPLGDSITDGVGAAGGYRAPLYTDLTNASYPSFTFVGSQTDNPGTLPASPVNQQQHEGHSGFTVGGIAAGINGWIAAANPGIILLHIGTNNFGGDSANHATNVSSADAVEMQLDSLVNQIFTDAPAVRLFVAGIIPKSGSLDQVMSYNNEIQSVLVPKYKAAPFNKGITFVDQYPNFVDNNGNLFDLPDGVHPDAAGYQRMANTWAAALTVPEPGSLALLCLGGATLLMRRRRIA